jgi:protein TonB
LVHSAPDELSSSRRLALALAASVALHLALALWPAEEAERPQAGLPLLARLAAAPEAPAPPPARPAAKARKPAAKPPPARAAEAAAGADVVALRRRTASTIVLPADREAGEALQAAKLSRRQRDVPRSETLPTPATPRRPIVARYPSQALAKGLGGFVLVEAIVGERGRVLEVIVMDDQDMPELAQAALEAVRRARFEPARDAAGAARPSRLALRVEFSFE